MKSAQPALIKAYLAITLLVAALLIPSGVRAATGGPQTCTVGSSCLIGEFLYDDDYSPIATGAACTIESRDPSGNEYIPAGTEMSSSDESDGWYSYQITSAPTTTGVYRAQVCCTVGTDYLCLDKTFEVKIDSSSADSIASAVWNYSGRTLTGFGSFASDVWSSSSRTLTSFGSLVSNIWDNSSRTITNITSATDSDHEEIKKTLRENRLLLEKLVNKPIIENFLEEDNTPDLNAKIRDSKTIAAQLFANYQYIGSKSETIVSKWGVMSEAEILTSVNELSNLLGESTDQKTQNSIFGQVNWMKDSWDWKEVVSIYDQTQAVKNTLATVQMQLGSHGKNKYAQIEMKSMISYMDTLENLLGNSSDAVGEKTLFGELNQVDDIAKVLDSRLADVDAILSDWAKTKTESLFDKVDSLLTKVIAVNKIPNISTVLAFGDKNEDPVDKKVKNKLYGMRGIIISNKMLLARGAGKALSNTWMQEGSIVFKSLITNPSALVSQDVPLKYYLPPEVKKENIIEVSDGLVTEYDAEKNQFYVKGEFTLGPKETLTVMVRVEDIWVISDSDVESLRKQADELSKPLERTSYFAQGVTLKSDINVSLDKILAMKSEGVTPEAKIKAYREAQLELNGVNEKMDKLQDLVTQAGSTSTFFGFVGGAQTLAVWGLIIIMITGFVSLVIYMRMLGVRGKKKNKKMTDGDDTPSGRGSDKPKEIPVLQVKNKRSLKMITSYLLVAFLSATLSAFVTLFVVKNSGIYIVEKGSETQNQTGNADQVENNEVKENVVAGVNDQEEEKGVGGAEIVRVIPPEGKRVNIRDSASLDATIIGHFNQTEEVIKLGTDNNWVEVAYGEIDGLESDKEGWVSSEFVQTKDSMVESESQEKVASEETSITVLETPTGWLRVRSEPEGEEIGKIVPGDKYTLLSENSGWYEIALPNASSGWISSKYASVN